ncbi:MAG: hypothetical protein D4R84_03175 [Rhodocyclaceae bacterium]|nr:MAG: hypothetical protein D4R84_03175 [Rhodocyclaceae bacterium]
MRFATPALAALLTVAIDNGAMAANTVYRCTDETGLVLLTSDAGASRICTLLSSADKKCPGKQCAITITKNPDGHLYITGTANGTRVRYPVDSGASSVTICIRDQCKAR